MRDHEGQDLETKPDSEEMEIGPGRERVCRALEGLGEVPLARALRKCGRWTTEVEFHPDSAWVPPHVWGCKFSLCPTCAERKKEAVTKRYLDLVLRTAEEIQRRDPKRKRRFMVLTVTTPRTGLLGGGLAGVERAQWRRDVTERAFALLQGRLDWFRRPPRTRKRDSTASRRGGVWPLEKPRSSRADSLALAGWHVSTGWPHLHVLVYGASYVQADQIETIWSAAYEQAHREQKALWEQRHAAGQSSLGRFIRWRRAWRTDLQPVREPRRNHVRGTLDYLVEPGLSDEDMLKDPEGLASIITAWKGKHRIVAYGELWGKLQASTQP